MKETGEKCSEIYVVYNFHCCAIGALKFLALLPLLPGKPAPRDNVMELGTKMACLIVTTASMKFTLCEYFRNNFCQQSSLLCHVFALAGLLPITKAIATERWQKGCGHQYMVGGCCWGGRSRGPMTERVGRALQTSVCYTSSHSGKGEYCCVPCSVSALLWPQLV